MILEGTQKLRSNSQVSEQNPPAQVTNISLVISTTFEEVKMQSKFESISDDEIVSIQYEPVGRELSLNYNNFNSMQLKIQDFFEIIKRKLSVPDTTKSNLLNDGVNCQVLRFGSQGWQKGKLRIKVAIEFCPDEPEISEPETRFDDVR
jgi:hypothetical protein